MKNKKVVTAFAIGVVIMLMLGINPAWSVLSKAMVSQDGWTYSQASLPYTICGFGYAAGVLLFGIIYQKFGPKVTVISGGLMASIGLLICSLFYSSVPVAIGYGAFYGIGIAACYTSAITPMLKWAPPEMRSMASAIATTGFGIAGVYSSVVIGVLVSSFSMQTTFIILSIFTGTILLITSAFVKDPPPDYSYETKDGTVSAADEVSLTLREAVRKPAFYELFLIFTFVTGGGGAVMSNIASIVSFQSATVNPYIFSTIATVGNMVGRMVAGYLGGKFPRKYVLASFIGAMAACTLLIQFVHTAPVLIVTSFIIFLGYGCEMALLPVLITDNFGVKYYSVIYGVIIAVSCIYNIIGPFLVGKLADAFGNFDIALFVCGAYITVGTVVSLLLPKKQP